MADQKISQLTEHTSPNLQTDFIPIADGTTETKKINLTKMGLRGNMRLLATPKNGGAPSYALDTFEDSDTFESAMGEIGHGAIDIQIGREGSLGMATGTHSLLISPGSSLVHGSGSSAVGRDNKVYPRNSHSFGELNRIRSGGPESIAVGRNIDVTGARSVACGNGIRVNQDSIDSIALGRNIIVTDEANGSIAIGNDIRMSGESSLAMGLNMHVSGDNSASFGRNVKVNANSVTEIGGWHSDQTRGVGLRLSNLGDSAAPSGSVAFTLPEKTFSPLDGGVAYGDEEASELPREMFSMRRDSDELLLDVNVAGTVKTVSLGDATRVGADDAETSRTSIGSAIQNNRNDSVTINSMRQVTQVYYNTLAGQTPSQVDPNTLYVIVG